MHTPRTMHPRHRPKRLRIASVTAFAAAALLVLCGTSAPPASALHAATRSSVPRSSGAQTSGAQTSDSPGPDLRGSGGQGVGAERAGAPAPGERRAGAARFEVRRSASDPPAGSSRWTPPLGFPIDVVAAYRAPPHRYGAGHRGVDLRPSARTGPVSATAPVDGTISFVGRVVDRPVVTIRVDDRTLVSLEPVTSALGIGTPVARGAVLGVLADGGHCDGECLHLGVRIDGEYANPMPFLVDRPILLPLGE